MTILVTEKESSPDGLGNDAYEPPELVKYGTLEELTGDIGTVGSDGITGSQLV